MCRYENLKNGKLDLGDVALMNDALDVQDENERLYMEAHKNE